MRGNIIAVDMGSVNTAIYQLGANVVLFERACQSTIHMRAEIAVDRTFAVLFSGFFLIVYFASAEASAP